MEPPTCQRTGCQAGRDTWTDTPPLQCALPPKWKWACPASATLVPTSEANARAPRTTGRRRFTGGSLLSQARTRETPHRFTVHPLGQRFSSSLDEETTVFVPAYIRARDRQGVTAH